MKNFVVVMTLDGVEVGVWWWNTEDFTWNMFGWVFGWLEKYCVVDIECRFLVGVGFIVEGIEEDAAVIMEVEHWSSC